MFAPIQCARAYEIKCALVRLSACLCRALPTWLDWAFSLACWHSSSLASRSAPNSPLIQNRPPFSVSPSLSHTHNYYSTCYRLHETWVYKFTLSSISSCTLKFILGGAEHVLYYTPQYCTSIRRQTVTVAMNTTAYSVFLLTGMAPRMD